MTPKEWAERLNGAKYGHELQDGDGYRAKKDGIVIMFGASDDLIEIHGAVEDEVGAWEEATIHFTKNGLMTNDCEDDDCPYFEQALKRATPIFVTGPNWRFKTDIPHERFMVWDNGDLYGDGIVFRLADVPEVKP